MKRASVRKEQGNLRGTARKPRGIVQGVRGQVRDGKVAEVSQAVP